MADEAVPQQMIQWMRARNWGAHHDEWHFCRRWDFWHELARQGDSDSQAMVDYAEQKQWQRAAVQEGEAGNGLEFLGMHRAMIQLLVRNFPEHFHVLRGWHTPPLDPADPEDAVADGTPFDGARKEGILKIEGLEQDFASEDEFGIYIETNLAPLPGEPLRRHEDPRRGIHNYCHNRWTDKNSPINLGDPKVNLENRRFWRLHGWIDFRWWKHRRAKGLQDDDPAYTSLIQNYVTMMDSPHHGHHHHAVAAAVPAPPRPAGFGRSFIE